MVKTASIESQSRMLQVRNLFKNTERDWNTQLVWDMFKPNIAREILSMHIPHEDKEDQLQTCNGLMEIMDK